MSYSTPVLSGSVPDPVTQPLQGVLNWTESDQSLTVAELLLHMDGTNGSTTFTDSSGSGVAITDLGATVSTAAPKFGTGCGSFGANQGLSAPIVTGGSLDLHAAGTWTVEGWFKIPAIYPGAATLQLIFSDIDAGSLANFCRLYYVVSGTTG